MPCSIINILDGKLLEGIKKLNSYGAELSTTPKLNVNMHLMLHNSVSPDVIMPTIIY